MGVYHVPMIRTNIHLPVKQLDSLEFVVIKTGLSRAEHVRRAIDLYLENLNKIQKQTKNNFSKSNIFNSNPYIKDQF